MDTKAVVGEKFEFVTLEESTVLNLELVQELKLEGHEEESFDPRNRKGPCSNS